MNPSPLLYQSAELMNMDFSHQCDKWPMKLSHETTVCQCPTDDNSLTYGTATPHTHKQIQSLQILRSNVYIKHCPMLLNLFSYERCLLWSGEWLQQRCSKSVPRVTTTNNNLLHNVNRRKKERKCFSL